MTAKSVYEDFISEPSRRRLLAQERLIMEATECLWRILEAEGVNKTELAEKLGKSNAFVTQVLNGSRNMTLRTFADLLFVLDHTVKLVERPLSALNFDYSMNSFLTRRVNPAISYQVRQEIPGYYDSETKTSISENKLTYSLGN